VKFELRGNLYIPVYYVFTVDTLCHAVTFDPLTLNVCSTSGHSQVIKLCTKLNESNSLRRLLLYFDPLSAIFNWLWLEVDFHNSPVSVYGVSVHQPAKFQDNRQMCRWVVDD